ncbi:unnamed protein product [Orchesella dallaii]|uniref:Uncharacterized protein n=1 Tax=Orchesella dallaii TaxID=48710 RepID=A0ABP1PQY8_9HEXA
MQQDDQVLLGVPLLYEQRKYVAKELGIDPRLIMGNMRDFIFRDRYPNADDMEDPMSLLSGQSLKRKKRGIIWNKIQRVKKGIQRVQKKLVSYRNRITQLFKGPDHSTERPKYASTAGDGGPKWKGKGGGGSTGSSNGWSGGSNSEQGNSNTGNSGGWSGNSNSGGGSTTGSDGGWSSGSNSGGGGHSGGGNTGGYGGKGGGGGGGTGNGWSQKSESSGGYSGSTNNNNNQNNQGGYGGTGNGNGWSRSATSSSDHGDTSPNTNNSPGGTSSSTVNTPHYASNTWSSQPQASIPNSFSSSYKRSSGVSAVRSSKELEMISQRFDF